ncbi:MAG: hypothetical protein ABI334_11105 [Candidatus Dormiibacterota bacterium]
MSVRTQYRRRTWSRAKQDLDDGAQAIALSLVVLPVPLALVAIASPFGLH